MDPAVQSLLDAVNAGDRAAFFAALAPNATMTDDGTPRDLVEWVDREIFTVNGHLDVESSADDGRSLTARYRNDTWGEMRTTWQFTVHNGQVTHFDTGQAR
ncbi:nuclear transport factor 2 family protein [Actinophytocola sp.]|uniref:nuclear transport factor 2 family protein n=1 Tax=Actinophytocola sp. TaxID=1872138 RepID=UPI003D6C0CE8